MISRTNLRYFNLWISVTNVYVLLEDQGEDEIGKIKVMMGKKVMKCMEEASCVCARVRRVFIIYEIVNIFVLVSFFFCTM